MRRLIHISVVIVTLALAVAPAFAQSLSIESPVATVTVASDGETVSAERTASSAGLLPIESQATKRRAVNPSRFTIVTRYFDSSLITAPAGGWTIGSVAAAFESRLGPGPYTWKARLVTHADRPWTEMTWLTNHYRYHDGTFDVIVWRESSSHYCATQTLALPAQPNQSVDYVLDLTQFASTDAVMFEAWEGYDVEITVSNGTKTEPLGTLGVVYPPPSPILHQQFEWTRCGGEGRP